MKKHYIKDLYITKRWYLLMAGGVVLFCISFFFPLLFDLSLAYLFSICILTALDYYLLFFVRGNIKATRNMTARFSLGDENKVSLQLRNSFPFPATLTIIDELPEQFQERSFKLQMNIPKTGAAVKEYNLRPVTRGEYEFGDLLCYLNSPVKLLQRKVIAAGPSTVKVYPSYQQLKKYQLLAISDQAMMGVKRIRRLGHSLEFEKIKTYVQGDDVRTINWKATARSSDLMVNTFTDTRQQQIYCMIDKGRSMKMPFEGMTLLDHSINAALALLNVTLMKHDRAGLITFANKVNDIVAAERRSGQLNHLLEALYKQQTDFKESDYEALWTTIHRRVGQRSCIMLFTNFETYSSLERQLPYLKKIATRHLLCVIFFENTLLKEIHETQPDSIEGIYIKTIADRFAFEKKQIVKELRRHGILSVLSTPQTLSVDVINKYLELKARQMI